MATFRTVIPISNDATYGSVMELREYLNGYGEVDDTYSAAEPPAERRIEFTWSIEIDETSVMDWAVHATVSSVTMDDRFDVIGQYVQLVNFHDEVYGEIGRLGFSAKGPQRVADGEAAA